MFFTIIIAIFIFLLTSFLHLAVLRWSSGPMAHYRMDKTVRVFTVFVMLFAAHFLQIAIYAAAFATAEHWLELGSFSGEPIEVTLDYLYFSAITYTSLGIGDIFPIGHLRFLTGVEALNGLMLIAWSASYLFAMMNHLWEWRPCTSP